MRNLIPLFVTLLIVVPALFLGKVRYETLPAEQDPQSEIALPAQEIEVQGEIEILNGSGVNGLGKGFKTFFKTAGFDVKNVDNARSMNYRHTLVISRRPEMAVAKRVAVTLGVERPIFIRTEFALYDATVIIGQDFRETKYGKN